MSPPYGGRHPRNVLYKSWPEPITRCEFRQRAAWRAASWSQEVTEASGQVRDRRGKRVRAQAPLLGRVVRDDRAPHRGRPPRPQRLRREEVRLWGGHGEGGGGG